MSFKRNPKNKFGLSPLDKYLLCRERKKPENISLSLKKFGEKFPRSDGKPRPATTLSDLFRNIDSIIEAGPPPSDDVTSVMQKTSQVRIRFPELEEHLIAWCKWALEKRLKLSDDLICLIAQRIAVKLTADPTIDEDYSDFQFSDGWIANIKRRAGMSSQKFGGEAGFIDIALVKSERVRLRELTALYTPLNTFNGDETGWKYV